MRSPLWLGMTTVSDRIPSYMLVWYMTPLLFRWQLLVSADVLSWGRASTPHHFDQMCAPLYTTCDQSTTPCHICWANADSRPCDRMRYRTVMIDNVGEEK